MRLPLHVGDLVARFARAVRREMGASIDAVLVHSAGDEHVRLVVVVDHATPSTRRHLRDLASDAEASGRIDVTVIVLDRATWSRRARRRTFRGVPA